MENKEIFSIRKFKTGTQSAKLGTLAVAASALAVASPAMADEIVDAPVETTAVADTVVDAPVETVVLDQAVEAVEAPVTVYETATNLENLQPEATQEFVDFIATEGQQAGELIEPVVDAQLDNLVETAKADEGLTVKEDPTVDHETLKEAEQDNATQKDILKEAIDTNQEVQSTDKEIREQATKGDVEIVETDPANYDNQPKVALEDIREQKGRVQEAVRVEQSIQDQLPAAQQTAEQAGVQVNKAKEVKATTDLKELMTDLSKHLAALETATVTERDRQSQIALALEDLKKKGIEVTTTDKTATTNLNKVKEDLTVIKDAVAEYVSAVDKHQSTLSSVKSSATSAGIVLNVGTQDVNSVEELAAIDTANESRVDRAIKALKSAQDRLSATLASVGTTVVKVNGQQRVMAGNVSATVDELVALIEATVKADQKALNDYEETVKANRAAEKEAREIVELAMANAKNTTIKDGGPKEVTLATAKEVATADAKAINDIEKANADEIKRVNDINTKGQAEADAKNAENKEVTDAVEAANIALKGLGVEISGTKVVTSKAEVQAYLDEVNQQVAYDKAEAEKQQQALANLEKLQAELKSNAENFKSQEAGKGLDYEIKTGTTITLTVDELIGITSLQDLVNKYPEAFQVAKDAVAGVAGTPGTEGTREEVVNQASVDARNEAIKKFEELNNAASSTTPDAGGYTPQGSYTHIKDVTVGGIRAVANGNFDTASIVNGAYTINLLLPEDGSVQISQVIQSIKFNQGSALSALDGGEIKEGFLQNKANLYYNYLNTYGQEILDGQNRSLGNTEGKNWYYDMDADAVVSPTTTYYSVQSGHWYKLSNAVTMADGSTHDLVFYVENINPQNIASGGEWVEIWNQNSAVNMINGYNVPGGALGSNSDNGLKRIYKIGSRDNNTNYVWSNVKSDIDVGQVYSDASDAGVVTVGGAISRSNWQASADVGDIKGLRDAPNGTIAEVHYGSEYGGTLRNTNFSVTGYTVALADFGNTATLNIIPAVTKDVIETPGTPGTPGTDAVIGEVLVANLRTDVRITSGRSVALLEADVTPASYTPITPELKEATAYTYQIKDPEKPTPSEVEIPELVMTANIDEATLHVNLDIPHVAVDTQDLKTQVELHKVGLTTHYHKVNVVQTPSNVKSVENVDGVDINEKTVAKNSTVKFLLDNEFLKAGRPVLTSVELEDYFREGFDGDLAASLAASPAWTTETVSGRTIVTLRAKELEKLNMNRDQDVQLPVFTAIGKVLNDAADYENVFKVIYNGGVTGNVYVRYFDEETGKELIPRFHDTVEAQVGSSYTTTDARPEVISDGEFLYERTPRIEGASEDGTVIEGDLTVDYFYKKVEPQAGKGNVVVNYINEKGETIAIPVIDERDAEVGKSYDTTDNKPNRITHDGIEYELIPTATIGEETGEVIEGTKEVTYVYKQITPERPKGNGYVSTSNKVVVRTPGKDVPNDPNDPNYDPNRPNDSIIKPTKVVLDKADGNDINDKNVLQGGKLHYIGTHDLDQYKGISLSSEELAKFSGFIDDFDETAVTPNLEEFYATKKGESEAIKGFKAELIEDLSLARQEIQDYLNWAGITPVGQFILWTAEDPIAFYKEYVTVGQSIDFHMPMTVNLGYDGTFENTVYQIDFGNGYKGDTVVNHTPKLDPIKEVSLEIDGENMNGGVIALGQEFVYTLKGAILPGNRAESIWQYDFIDDYDPAGDLWLGTYKVVAATDIRVTRTLELAEDATYDVDTTLADGTVIKAGEIIPAGTKITYVETIAKGTDLTEYTFTEHDEVEGILTISFTDEFLQSVLLDSEFGATAYLDFKRIAAGEFENKFINRINGVDYVAEIVKTSTPAPEVPVEPGVPVEVTPEIPAEPAPEAPVETPAPEEKVLPNTGAEAGLGLSALGMMMTMLGSVGIKRRKK